MIFIYPIPAFGMPVPEILVTASIYKFQVFLVGNQGRAYFKSIQINFMPVQFIIKTKTIAFKTYFVNTFFHFYKFIIRVFHSSLAKHILWNKQEIMDYGPKYI